MFYRRVFQVVLGLVLGLAATLFWMTRQGPEVPLVSGTDLFFLPDPLPAPQFTLTSHEGTSVSSEDFPGKVLVVFFGYTFCPDVCPLTLSRLTRAFASMEKPEDQIQVLLVTVDPGRDTPDQLSAYLSNFHPSFLGLTGTLEALQGVAEGFGAYFSTPPTGEGYTVDHTARIFVVDRFGRIPLTFPFEATPDEIARDLTTLLEISGG